MPKYDPFLKKLRASDTDAYNKGRYANEADINIAYPAGAIGWYVLNYDTDTWWTWDGTTSAWVDTDRKGQVSSVFGRAGVVLPVQDDYTHEQLSTIKIAADGVTNGHVKYFQKAFSSANSTGFVWTDNVLAITHSLTKSNLSITLVDGSGNQIDGYTATETDTSTIAINFPVAQIPITGTWNVKIF